MLKPQRRNSASQRLRLLYRPRLESLEQRRVLATLLAAGEGGAETGSELESNEAEGEDNVKNTSPSDIEDRGGIDIDRAQLNLAILGYELPDHPLACGCPCCMPAVSGVSVEHNPEASNSESDNESTPQSATADVAPAAAPASLNGFLVLESLEQSRAFSERGSRAPEQAAERTQAEQIATLFGQLGKTNEGALIRDKATDDSDALNHPATNADDTSLDDLIVLLDKPAQTSMRRSR